RHRMARGRRRVAAVPRPMDAAEVGRPDRSRCAARASFRLFAGLEVLWDHVVPSFPRKRTCFALVNPWTLVPAGKGPWVPACAGTTVVTRPSSGNRLCCQLPEHVVQQAAV